MAELLEIGHGQETVDAAVVTTAETQAVVSDAVLIPGPGRTCLVMGFCQFTTGAAATAVTPRLRRGAGTAGTIIDDAVALSLAAAAGGNEQFILWARDEDLGNIDQIQYTLTLQQTGATGNGSILQAVLVVFIV